MDGKAILICYDGTEESKHAIDAAAEVLGPRRAVVLDVGPVLTVAESFVAMTPGAPGAAFEDVNEADARSRARDGAAHARSAGFDAAARADLATPAWRGIVDAADDLDAAVIAIGTRALTGPRQAFEGSVSHQVVQHAGRPVLVVPPKDGR
jgi:nucleotide-binding universal stress UspA family protein